MTIDLYLHPSGVVVWNYWTLIVMVAFDGYLSELFFEIHLEENKTTLMKNILIKETRTKIYIE